MKTFIFPIILDATCYHRREENQHVIYLGFFVAKCRFPTTLSQNMIDSQPTSPSSRYEKINKLSKTISKNLFFRLKIQLIFI